VAIWSQDTLTTITVVQTLSSVPSRNSLSEKDSDPTLQGDARAHADGLRHKSAFAEPINYSGSGTAISEQCEIT
jgi:hypothetical protein